MKVLGLSAFYHDSAAALVVNGEIIAAAQEERFTRKKHDAGYPRHAIDYVLSAGGLTPSDIDYVAFYEKPFLKFERLLETYVSMAPRGFKSFAMALPLWMREKLYQKDLLSTELNALVKADWNAKLVFSEHHLSHAASAFFASPFQDAAVLTMDGVGEWATTSLAIGHGNALTIEREIHFPHSLGLLYSAFTYYTGFRVNSGEYKLMGLAPYGEPKYVSQILENLIDVKPDGSFRLDMKYFDYCAGLTMTSQRFDHIFGGPARNPEDPLTQRHMDLAASVQFVLEDVVLRLARSIASQTGMRNLCLAGGVALNCVANGKVLRDGCFDKIWIQPASGDAGGALGAALAASFMHLGVPRKVVSPDSMHGSYLGPSYADDEIETTLHRVGARFVKMTDAEMFAKTADCLAAGLAIGWFQGRMEFGPRALGNRSILGDARSPAMQKILNLKIKYRESFRPFAPAVLAEDAADYFDLNVESPYMLLVAPVRQERRRPVSAEEAALFGIEKLNVPRSDIPAVTHVDYSARVQTVRQDTNPKLHALLSMFKERTGCSVLANTSFNVRGEPIVCTPEDAFRCFMGTDLDILVVGNCVLRKEDQDSALAINYKNQFELD
ncbi:MAG: carbamoyltransferase [Rhodocyclaceae bacterium]|nr:carbamoyltransferase [Rhodocyclaceae bacterium]MDZ4215565.1 carbamoyltransferase [Rhodocyclaceae bacterium]